MAADIIKDFRSYVGQPNLENCIKWAPEFQIATKYQELDEDIQSMRTQTMRFTRVNSKGVVISVPDKRLDALLAKIAGQSQRLEALQALISQYNAALDGHDVRSTADLREIQQQHANTIQSGPIRAWDIFRMKRDLSIERGQHKGALPSDLALLPDYQAEESAIRAQIETATAAKALVDASLVGLKALADQADGI